MLEDLAPVAQILQRLTWTRIKCWLGKHGRPHTLFHSMFLHAVSLRPVFVRGLCETPNGNILVGISPAAIIELDWKSGKLVDFFPIRMMSMCVCMGWPANSLYETGFWNSQDGLVFARTFLE